MEDTMKEIYDIIIEKLERDKLHFSTELKDLVEKIDISDMAKVSYYKVRGKKEYCMDLIEFFEEARKHV